MSWEKLCELREVPPDSAALFSVAGRDVLFVRTEDSYLAMPPLCRHMRQPLVAGCFEECFENGHPVCNEQQDGSEESTTGVASVPLRGFATRDQDGVVYVDVTRQEPLPGVEHVTCSPERTGPFTGDLVVNIWKEGFENEKETVRREAVLKPPAGKNSR